MSIATTSRAECVQQAPQNAWPRKLNLFGVSVTPTTCAAAAEVIVQAARRRDAAVVSCQAVHAVITSSTDPSLRDKVNGFEMITPDGQPVRWALNLLHGTGLTDSVRGRDLSLQLCRRAAREQVSIYLYGGSQEVIDRLQHSLPQMCPGLVIAGAESPPFRPLTVAEDLQVVQRINDSGAGLVFIGLGFPKQDLFACEHRDRIRGVQICVGAAFDFHAGTKTSAPVWMQRRGLEWFYRLMQEPTRLWRRYLETNTLFIAMLVWSLLRRLLHGRPDGEDDSQGRRTTSN